MMSRGKNSATSPIQLVTYNSNDLESYRANNSHSDADAPSPEAPRGTKAYLSWAQSSITRTGEISDVSQEVQQAHPPVFVPRFSNLRRTCLEQTQLELRTLDNELQHSGPSDRSAKVADAVRLLKQLDQATENEVTLLQMEDPNYATSRGLTVVQFLTQGNPIYDGQWIMISRAWGNRSRNIVDTNINLLSPYHQKCVQDFISRSAVSCKQWFLRPKTASESRPGSLLYKLSGTIVRRTVRIALWRVIFLIVVLALICFYGVGIIATNSTFSPIFVHYFYWVAIFWSLISSSLLAWICVVFGATQRDSFGAFLSAIAIWLVVIQIGQTHLNGQNAQAAAANSTVGLR